MRDARRNASRLCLGLGILLLGLLEAQDHLLGLRAHTRLRERAVREARRDGQAALLRAGEMLARTPPAPLRDVVREVAGVCGGEADLRELPSGRLRAGSGPFPVDHWPAARELEQVAQGRIWVAGPVAGQKTRLLTYLPLRTPTASLVLRVSTPVPDLVEDLRERRTLLLGRGLGVALLVVGGGLALLGRRREGELSPGALLAYEEAMAQLRDRGRALRQQHRAELRRLEGVLEDREAMARAGELTAGIVHEVRNGLGTILGYARMAERSADPGAAEAGDGIRREVEALEAVVRRFSDFVRREKLALADLDLARVLGRVVSREAHRAAFPSAEVVAGEAVTVVGDEDLLEAALENLVRNAVDAAGPGGHVRAAVERDSDGVHALVTVSDDGPGLPPEVKGGLRPFLTTKPGGMGLGLPIALKLVQLHGGSLELRDRSPRGVEARVRLPLEGPPAEGDGPSPVAGPA